MSLYQFQALVCHGCRVYRYFRPHRPVRVGKGLLGSDRSHLFEREFAKWTTRCRQYDSIDVAIGHPLQALEHGVVLAVCRYDSDPCFSSRFHDEFTANYKSFLIGENNVVSSLNGSQSREQARRSYYGDQGDFGFGQAGQLFQTTRAPAQCGITRC